MFISLSRPLSLTLFNSSLQSQTFCRAFHLSSPLSSSLVSSTHRVFSFNVALLSLSLSLSLTPLMIFDRCLSSPWKVFFFLFDNGLSALHSLSAVKSRSSQHRPLPSLYFTIVHTQTIYLIIVNIAPPPLSPSYIQQFVFHLIYIFVSPQFFLRYSTS
jgi:hypothetical protein